jgi:hypothetical protein
MSSAVPRFTRVAWFTVAVALLVAGSLQRVDAEGLVVTTLDGGSVTTDLGYGIKTNKNSTLHRTWVILNDPACPVQISEAGLSISYGDRQFNFLQVGTLTASEPVSAFEVRYVLYDVFGEHLKTLSATAVTDVAANSPRPLRDGGSWRAWDNEVTDLMTVVAFVAQVRTQSGKIWRYQDKALSQELGKIKLQASAGVLDPTKKEK